MFATNGMSKVGAMMIVAGLTLGWAGGARAQSSDRVPAEARATAAQAQADAARQRANDLAKAGGWAYKTGLVQQAQRDAARYQAEADEANAEVHSCPAVSQSPSPALLAALGRLEELRQAGGWAYKTGAVARAEREVQSLTAGGEETESAPMTPAQAAALARLEELRRAGGWAYKTGAVTRAEQEVQSLAPSRGAAVCQGRQAPRRALTASAR